jgi:lipopolysaccharide export system permease protein
LYDIKHTKPALDIKAGAFYNGIPDYSIKAKNKLPDGKTLLDVIIYDHSEGRGNKTIILADSSLMYTILDDRYLKLELYNGNYYSEKDEKKKKINQFYRTEYYRMDMVFSLASFDLTRRKEELFQNNRQMKNIKELTVDIDSFATIISNAKSSLVLNSDQSFTYHIKNKKKILEKNTLKRDTVLKEVPSYITSSMWPFSSFDQKLPPRKNKKFSLRDLPKRNVEEDHDPNLFILQDTLKKNNVTNKYSKTEESLNLLDKKPISDKKSIINEPFLLDTAGWDFLERKLNEPGKPKRKVIMSSALNQARNIKVNVQSAESRVYRARKDKNLYTIEKYKKYSQALACVIMFLIGAPLGAIIKKGGLGMPTIIAILFFIIYYVFTSIGEKSAKEGAMNPHLAVWLSDMVLFPFGLFFLRQARVDARLFDMDFYNVWIEKLKLRFAKKKKEL